MVARWAAHEAAGVAAESDRVGARDAQSLGGIGDGPKFGVRVHHPPADGVEALSSTVARYEEHDTLGHILPVLVIVDRVVGRDHSDARPPAAHALRSSAHR